MEDLSRIRVVESLLLNESLNEIKCESGNAVLINAVVKLKVGIVGFIKSIKINYCFEVGGFYFAFFHTAMMYFRANYVGQWEISWIIAIKILVEVTYQILVRNVARFRLFYFSIFLEITLLEL